MIHMKCQAYFLSLSILDTDSVNFWSYLHIFPVVFTYGIHKVSFGANMQGIVRTLILPTPPGKAICFPKIE